MRAKLLFMLGSVTVAPFSCGESPAPSSSSTAKKAKTVVEQKSGKAVTPKQQNPDDPLIPPIDFGNPVVSGNVDFRSDDRARFHAHGEKVCASGCAASRHPTGVLSKTKYFWLLRRFAEQPMTSDSSALETLLYFGRQTSGWMKLLGTKPLDEQRVALLKRELKRTHALISFRIVDEYGITRVHMPPTRVPLDRRHEFKMSVKDLPPLITSGTVKRVGLHHLWTRL